MAGSPAGIADVLGRYSIHYHLVGDTMRGSQVLGAAIDENAHRELVEKLASEL